MRLLPTFSPTVSPALRPARWRSAGAALLLAAGPVLAAPTAMPRAADAALEARVQAVAEELRCLVCQNETIAGSTAPLALDLRAQIHRQLAEGRSEAEVMAYMTARYGDFVRYRPPLDARTGLLWGGPFALLLVGGIALGRRLRRAAPHPMPLADREDLLARLDKVGP